MDGLEPIGFFLSNLGGMGVVAWALWHTLSKTIPAITDQFLEELKAIRQVYETRDARMIAAIDRLGARVSGPDGRGPDSRALEDT